MFVWEIVCREQLRCDCSANDDDNGKRRRWTLHKPMKRTYLYLGKGIPFTREAVHIGKVRVANVSTTWYGVVARLSWLYYIHRTYTIRILWIMHPRDYIIPQIALFRCTGRNSGKIKYNIRKSLVRLLGRIDNISHNCYYYTCIIAFLRSV